MGNTKEDINLRVDSINKHCINQKYCLVFKQENMTNNIYIANRKEYNERYVLIRLLTCGTKREIFENLVFYINANSYLNNID